MAWVGWITILALVLMMMGFPVVPTKAAQLTQLKDTISDSDLGVVANHEIYFLSPTGTATGTTITLTFDSGFSIPAALDYTDIDILISGSNVDIADQATTSVWGATTTGQVITLTAPTAGSGLLGANATCTIKIGTNATYGVTGDQQITNPGTAGSYTIDIAGTFGDTGTAMVAIIEDVTITATVAATLTFTISGVGSGQSVNGATTTITTNATSVAFGTLTVNSSSTAAQDLAVTTNADDGFTVTIFQDQNLTSGGGSDIDCFDDGVCVDYTSAASWSAPAGILDQEDTYGHFGITSEDESLGTNCASDYYGTDLWAGLSGTTQAEVMCHTGPADGSTAHKGAARVGFNIEITALQEAGDYTNTLTYIATPTY
jgi:hypothetical protein